MWIFTTIGFYSVTVSSKDSEKIQIRARDKDDLIRLKKIAEDRVGVDLGDVLLTPNADYRYRLICDRTSWLAIAVVLAEKVNYTNFKNQIDDPFRHFLYSKIWEIMTRLQARSLRKEVES